jgi:hypothetical protein
LLESGETGVEFDHTVEVSGWYFLQAWGGDGGTGTGGALGWSKGAAGGTGGYASGYVKLQKGDVIEIFAGVDGADGNGSSKPGAGGRHSRVSLVKLDDSGNIISTTVLMIAGGGGGGGAGRNLIIMGGDGKAGQSVADGYQDKLDYPGNDFAYYDGVGGEIAASNGALAGYNYINTDLVKFATVEYSNNGKDITSVTLGDETISDDSIPRFEDLNTNTYDRSHGGGTAHLNCLEINMEDSMLHLKADIEVALTDFGISADISKYFNCEGVDFDWKNRDHSTSPNISITGGFGEVKSLNVKNIIPYVNVSGEGTTATAAVDFDIIIKLTADSEFMGGNDVPLFVDGVTLSHIQYYESEEQNVSLDSDTENAVDPVAEEGVEAESSNNLVPTEKSIILGGNDATDYANVELKYTKPDMVGNKLVYTPGDAPIAKESLYTINSGERHSVPEDGDWRYDF